MHTYQLNYYMYNCILNQYLFFLFSARIEETKRNRKISMTSINKKCFIFTVNFLLMEQYVNPVMHCFIWIWISIWCNLFHRNLLGIRTKWVLLFRGISLKITLLYTDTYISSCMRHTQADYKKYKIAWVRVEI